MSSFSDQLETAETLAESDLEGALQALDAMRSGLSPEQLSQLHLQKASFTARLGKLDAAIEELVVAEAFANTSGRLDVAMEIRVTRASILAALGKYGDAIPMLKAVVKTLESHPELSQLRADATAELRSYESLVSPKPLGGR